MYTRVEKTKEGKSKAVANSVIRKKGIGKNGLEFVDNRPGPAFQRKLHKIEGKRYFDNQVVQMQGMLKTAQLTGVLQGNWVCTGCGNTGEGRVYKKKWADCGKKAQEEVTAGREAFGTWWEKLSEEERQRLLRAHGSHEAHGGRKIGGPKGGGKKGDQHDQGVAKAKEQIKKNYERGQYDEGI